MARKTVRIAIPVSNPDGLAALAGKIHAKHTDLKDKSPLKALGELDMGEFGEQVVEAQEHRNNGKSMESQAQEANGRAATIIGVAPGQTQESRGTLLFAVTQIRDLLAAMNKGNEEALSLWGFDVVIGQARPRKSKVTGNGSGK